jgi:pimeloyl-ACP methyl ester carboxylesterase
MPTAISSGLRIYYEQTGDGPPLVLVHGWTANASANFKAFGWVDELQGSFRLLLPDLRGHGRSAKPWRPSAYSPALLAEDVIAAMDSAGIGEALLFGYSTGAQVAAQLLIDHGQRFHGAVLGGIGAEFRFGWGRRFAPEDGLPRRPIDWFPVRRAPAFLSWLRNDPIALAYAFRGLCHQRAPVDLPALRRVEVPVLVLTGTRDGFCRTAQELVAALPRGEFATLSGRNHVTTLGDRRARRLVREYLERCARELERPLPVA